MRDWDNTGGCAAAVTFVCGVILDNAIRTAIKLCFIDLRRIGNLIRENLIRILSQLRNRIFPRLNTVWVSNHCSSYSRVIGLHSVLALCSNMQSNIAIFIHRVLHGILAAPVDAIPDLIANDRAAVVVIQDDRPTECGSFVVWILLCLMIYYRRTGFRRAGILDPVGIRVCIIVMVVIVIFNRDRILPVIGYFNISLVIQGKSIHICGIRDRHRLVMAD